MIRKAVVPVAGLGTRLYPLSVILPKGLMPFVLSDGRLMTGLELIAESLLEAGVEQIGIVVSPATRPIYEAFLAGGGVEYAAARARRPELQSAYTRLQRLRRHLTLLEQPQPWGLGHAVWCAREFAGDEPALVLLGDHILLPPGDPTLIQQVIHRYETYQSPVYSVHRVPLNKVALYGILQGEPTETPRCYRLRQLCEKPTADYARRYLQTEGLAPDEFFAHSGIYAFPPALWDTLAAVACTYSPEQGEWTLTEVQQALLKQMPAYLYEPEQAGLDFGTPSEYQHAFCHLAGCNDV